jgi:hypothetical protein
MFPKILKLFRQIVRVSLWFWHSVKTIHNYLRMVNLMMISALQSPKLTWMSFKIPNMVRSATVWEPFAMHIKLGGESKLNSERHLAYEI